MHSVCAVVAQKKQGADFVVLIQKQLGAQLKVEDAMYASVRCEICCMSQKHLCSISKCHNGTGWPANSFCPLFFRVVCISARLRL